MPITTIPLVGEETRRGLGMSSSTSKDQYFAGCVFTKASNNATRSSNWYVEKRPGLSNTVISAGNVGNAIHISPSTGLLITAFGGSNSDIFETTTNVGTITGQVGHITETIIGGITFYLIASLDGTGWYLASNASADTSFTGDTHTNTTIDNIAGASGVYVGQLITGTGIQAGTRVATRTPDTSTPTSITTTIATTGTASITITKEPIAKIIDADFPTMVGGFACMDGYTFAITSAGKIYNSDLNSIISWNASNYIEANLSTDKEYALIKYNNHIIAFGNSSVEFFYNAGNPTGSVLSARKELFSQIGITGGQGICQIDDYVFWISNTLCLYTFDGLSPKNLSVQGMILGTNNVPPYSISAFHIGTDTIVHIICTTSTSDKWFSIENNSFYEPVCSIANLRIFSAPTPSSTGIAQCISLSNTSGALYAFSTAVYQDNGSAFTLTIQTEPKVLNKGKGFIINSVELLADDQSSGSTQLEISRDDYTTFQVLGNFGLTSRRKRITRGGFCRNHAIFRLTDSGNNAWRGQALVVDWTPCKT